MSLSWILSWIGPTDLWQTITLAALTALVWAQSRTIAQLQRDVTVLRGQEQAAQLRREWKP